MLIYSSRTQKRKKANMGVPSFHRWLVNKYPKIVSGAVEDKDQNLDFSSSSPKEPVFDILYVDMNGIIHPSFQPDDKNLGFSSSSPKERVFDILYVDMNGIIHPSFQPDDKNLGFSSSSPKEPVFDILYVDMNGIIHPSFQPDDKNLGFSSSTLKEPAFDNLYLDMNGIIHPCFHPADNVLSQRTFEEVFNSIYESIDRLFNIVRPRKLLFMAIDGVAPRAKRNKRRLPVSKDAQTAEEVEDKLGKQFEREGKSLYPKQESQVSDSNVITPGTEFMHILSEKLRSYINLRMNENPAWRGIKVILSDDTVPGEGEHKIMSFIRAQRSLPGYDPNTRHCLYGQDADLIMLALATHEIHFSILREVTTNSESVIESKNSVISKEIPWSVKKSQPCQFLHLWILREYLALDMKIPNPPENFEYDIERIIDDFIFICFFAGNDFLPRIPSLEIHEGCIDLLMHVYKKEIPRLGGYLVDMEKDDDRKAGYIKFESVERFMLSVGMYEEKIFCKRSQIHERNLRRNLAEYRDSKNDEKNHRDDGCSSDTGVSFGVANVDQPSHNTKELKQKHKNYVRHQSDLFKDGALGTDKVKLGTPGWRERYYKENFSVETPDEIEAKRKEVVAKYGEGLCWVLLYYFQGVPSWTWFYPYNYGPFASDMKGLSQIKPKFQKGSPFKPSDPLLAVPPSKDYEKIRKFRTMDRLFVNKMSQPDVLSRQTAASMKIKDARMMDSTIDGIKGVLHLMNKDCNKADSDDNGKQASLCMFYEVPEGVKHIPQLLECVNIPEKMVDEDDVVETVLWHERHGSNVNMHRNPRHKQPMVTDREERKIYNLSQLSRSGEKILNSSQLSRSREKIYNVSQLIKNRKERKIYNVSQLI